MSQLLVVIGAIGVLWLLMLFMVAASRYEVFRVASGPLEVEEPPPWHSEDLELTGRPQHQPGAVESPPKSGERANAEPHG